MAEIQAAGQRQYPDYVGFKLGDGLKGSGHLSIKGTVKSVDHAGSIDMSNAICEGTFKNAGSALIIHSQLGYMQVAGDTDLRNSSARDIVASGGFYATNCLQLGHVNASGYVELNGCQEIDSVTSSGELKLYQTNVKHTLTHAGDRTTVVDSTIGGKSEWALNWLRLENTSTGDIVIKSGKNSSTFDFFCMRFTKTKESSEQVVELVGDKCRVASITFVEGKGQVILKDGAQVTGAIIGGTLQA